MRNKIENFKKVFDTDENNRIKLVSLKAEIFELDYKFSEELAAERDAK